jgi:hypothetical protein
VGEQIVEPDDEGQEIVTAQRGPFAQLLQQILERMSSGLDRLDASAAPSPLTLCISRNSSSILRRKPASSRAGTLSTEFMWFSVASTSSRNEVSCCGSSLRMPSSTSICTALLACDCCSSRPSSTRDVTSVTDTQHLARTAIALDAVEVEFEVADVALREPHLDFGERVDALDEIFVGALAPEQLDVLERRVERLLGHETEQQVIEAEPVELVAA